MDDTETDFFEEGVEENKKIKNPRSQGYNLPLTIDFSSLEEAFRNFNISLEKLPKNFLQKTEKRKSKKSGAGYTKRRKSARNGSRSSRYENDNKTF